MATKCDDFRWVFGMFCRKTKITIIDFVFNRKRETLFKKIK